MHVATLYNFDNGVISDISVDYALPSNTFAALSEMMSCDMRSVNKYSKRGFGSQLTNDLQLFM